MSEKNKKNEIKNDNACNSCNSCGTGLLKLGIDLGKHNYIVALAGNPNTGKSTVFNALTGLHQHTGNWPGKTVTRAEGAFQLDDKRYKLVDLPGTYSLLSTSTDEEIARDFILFARPDCTIVVVDATCLERNLNLVLQVLEITDKVCVALNLVDEAKRKGIEIDHRQLARDLGVPVVPTVAKTSEGIKQLIEEVGKIVRGDIITKPHKIQGHGDLHHAVDTLVPEIQKYAPNLDNARWVAMRILDGDYRMREALLNGELLSLSQENMS